jgi:hypothetical protein
MYRSCNKSEGRCRVFFFCWVQDFEIDTRCFTARQLEDGHQKVRRNGTEFLRHVTPIVGEELLYTYIFLYGHHVIIFSSGHKCSRHTFHIFIIIQVLKILHWMALVLVLRQMFVHPAYWNGWRRVFQSYSDGMIFNCMIFVSSLVKTAQFILRLWKGIIHR